MLGTNKSVVAVPRLDWKFVWEVYITVRQLCSSHMCSAFSLESLGRGWRLHEPLVSNYSMQELLQDQAIRTVTYDLILGWTSAIWDTDDSQKAQIGMASVELIFQSFLQNPVRITVYCKLLCAIHMLIMCNMSVKLSDGNKASSWRLFIR